MLRQAATAAAAKAAALREEADKAAAQATKKAARLEDALHAAKAEQAVLVTQSEEASVRVAAAQAARDRAVKEVRSVQFVLKRSSVRPYSEQSMAAAGHLLFKSLCMCSLWCCGPFALFSEKFCAHVEVSRVAMT